MRVLSLGAGVQSSTLLLMACQGELALDAAIFADTQWESGATYAHLATLEQHAQAHGLPVYRVTQGNLRDGVLAGEPTAWTPLHLRNQDGATAMLKRQCTRAYKLRPIRRQLRALWLAAGRPPLEQAIGISLDEVHRLKPSGVAYVENVYPLIDRRMTRADCLRWLATHDYPTPPKSACLGCPYHDNGYWRALRADSPTEWAATVAVDSAIRHSQRGEVYIHRSLAPLDQADIRSEQERGQLDLFGEECAGVCGV